MKSLIIILGIILVSFSCEQDSDPAFPVKAEVLGENIDCHEYEIKILDHLDKVISLFGKSAVDSVYIAGNLPDTLKRQGLSIVLDVDKPSESFETACSFRGPTLNWIWITRAKPAGNF